MLQKCARVCHIICLRLVLMSNSCHLYSIVKMLMESLVISYAFTMSRVQPLARDCLSLLDRLQNRTACASNLWFAEV